MQYRGSRGVAHINRLRNGEADETFARTRRKRSEGIRAAARAVVESLEQRQLLAAGDPIINEFMTDNATGIRDVNLERHDWIEVYNPGASAVNLQGWKLQD